MEQFLAKIIFIKRRTLTAFAATFPFLMGIMEISKALRRESVNFFTREDFPRI